MVIYTVLAKKIEKMKTNRKKNEKIKNPQKNFWGPCQVLNIYQYIYIYITAIYLKTGVPENPLPDSP